MSARAAAAQRRSSRVEICGTMIADAMPMITTTQRISMSVNALRAEDDAGTRGLGDAERIRISCIMAVPPNSSFPASPRPPVTASFLLCDLHLHVAAAEGADEVVHLAVEGLELVEDGDLPLGGVGDIGSGGGGRRPAGPLTHQDQGLKHDHNSKQF